MGLFRDDHYWDKKTMIIVYLVVTFSVLCGLVFAIAAAVENIMEGRKK